MKNFLEYFLGNHNISFHIAGLVFSLIGTFIAKYHFWSKHKDQSEVVCESPKFNINYWFKNNLIEVILSLLTSFVVVRFIDILLLWLNPKIEVAFGFSIPLTTDQIFYYLIIAFLIQFWVHRKYRKK